MDDTVRKITAEDINPRYNWGRALPAFGSKLPAFSTAAFHSHGPRYAAWVTSPMTGAAPQVPAPPVKRQAGLVSSVRITQVKSRNGANQRQLDTLRGAASFESR